MNRDAAVIPKKMKSTVTSKFKISPYVPEQAMTIAAKYKLGPVFTPPTASKASGLLATLTLGTAGGGSNWWGASYDPETHTVFASASNA